MNYQVITDEQKLLKFIDWLPDLQPDEKYYLCLFARNKYCKELSHIKSDKAQLKRFVTDKQRMLSKIKQLEVEMGWYRQREFPVPQEALALYITVNPRNMMKATVNTMVKLAQSIRDQNVMMNPHQEALSEIQKAKSRTCFVDFDIDSKQHFPDREEMNSLIGDGKYHVVESRGGYHLMVEPKSVPETHKRWYQEVQRVYKVDQVGDLMIPVPGTYQGGFTPKFVTEREFTYAIRQALPTDQFLDEMYIFHPLQGQPRILGKMPENLQKAQRYIISVATNIGATQVWCNYSDLTKIFEL